MGRVRRVRTDPDTLPYHGQGLGGEWGTTVVFLIRADENPGIGSRTRSTGVWTIPSSFLKKDTVVRERLPYPPPK